ncbi:MAG: SdiA-regulated domain-containing protein [Saprospiraceae bacterium]
MQQVTQFNLNRLQRFRISFTLTIILLAFYSCQGPSSDSKDYTLGATSDSIPSTPTVEKDVEIVKSSLDTNTKALEKATPISFSKSKAKGGFKFRYDLSNSDFTGTLHKELTEISGLSYDIKSKTLLAINDEVGRLYRLDTQDFSLIDKKVFGELGDYEGIEMAKGIIYVLKSNGHIYPLNPKTLKAEDTFKTDLNSSNDVEGLAYDDSKDELILACKGNPEVKDHKKLKDVKAFYRFEFDDEEIKKKPKFTISDDDLEDFTKDHYPDDISKKEKKKLKSRAKDFSPSAIAKHPIDGHYYILSSVGKLLVVCDNDGDIKIIHFLDAKKFSQPEGICFAPDGTMFISNEGRGIRGRASRFSYLK